MGGCKKKIIYNEADENYDKSYAVELKNISYSDRTSTQNVVHSILYEEVTNIGMTRSFGKMTGPS